MQAYDSSVPSQTTTADLTINVLRNINPPVFSQDTYSTRISEAASIGSRLIDTTATDLDNVSLQSSSSFSHFDISWYLCIRSEENTSIYEICIRVYYQIILLCKCVMYRIWYWWYYMLLILQDRLTYSLRNNEQRCVDMFFIDTANGDIFLKKSFLDISDVTFSVGAIAPNSEISKYKQL